MSRQAKPAAWPRRWVVFSDLDGTLLDHHSYSHEAALPALRALRELGIPCILCTSKTRPEVLTLREQLGNRDPFIVENGSAVFLPEEGGLRQHDFARPRTEILSILADDRQLQSFAWRGFADMSIEEIAERTGLSREQAEAASWREYCEPIVWLDSDHNRERFLQALGRHGLRGVQGGRFLHLMDAAADKGRALEWLRQHYAQDATPGEPVGTIALGDSDNDRGMLQAADIAVLVRSDQHDYPAAEGRQRTLRSQAYGPEGWNQIILELLDELDLKNHG